MWRVVARKPLRAGNKFGRITFAPYMNRPRNRQGRPPRNRPPASEPRDRHWHNNNASNVPSMRQVTPGASVSIVLKADQPTGRETQGTVRDVLTHGDHPRGIKVRLMDGQIGRVQRMSPSPSASTIAIPEATTAASPLSKRSDLRDTFKYEGKQTPPAPFSLTDFMRHDDRRLVEERSSSELATTTVQCPMCDFHGDATAVSHHVQTHLD